jgi:hypothetical protein
MVQDDTNRLTPYHVIHGWFPVMPFHYIACCPLKYIPKRLHFLYMFFLFVCFVNKMLFIIEALHYSKLQVHVLSFIDKTMHKSLQHRQSSRRRLHRMRTPLYILSDTQMCRKIHGRCYENIETP